MKHNIKGKKLNRTKSHRESMYQNLATSLFEYGRIETTLAKAKAVRPLAEKLITKARRQNLSARRDLLARIKTKQAFINLWEKIAPAYKERAGGYTRVIKLGYRAGDQAPKARIELVENPLGEDAPNQTS